MQKLKYSYKQGETPIERLRNKIQVLFGVISLAEVDERASPELKEAAGKASGVLEDVKDLLDDVENINI